MMMMIIQFSLIHFSSCLLKCRLNNISASYKARTKTQIKHKTAQTHQNETLNRQNKIKHCSKSDIKVLEQKKLNPEKTDNLV
jgi:hypothetical protein